MAWISFSTSARSKKGSPAVRAYAAASGKRFQCDLCGFWRQCRLAGCRRRRGCTGDPYDCFRRHYAAMPRDHKDWGAVERLSMTSGACFAERELRIRGLPMPGRIEPERVSLPPPRADAAAPAVVPARETEVIELAREVDELLSKSTPDGIANLEKNPREHGMILRREIDPEQAIPPPSLQADEAAPVVAPKGGSPPSALRPWDVRKGMDYDDMMARLRALGGA